MTSEKRDRSFSQWSQYDRCPYSYYLSRIEKKPRIQAAWSPQGTAIHHALETWERAERELEVDEVQSIFDSAYTREIKLAKQIEPDLDLWFGSGPYDPESDIERRRKLGKEQVAKVLQWYRKHPTERPWRHPDGRIGVELPFRMLLGSVWVRGVIDWIGHAPWKGKTLWIPRDYKSGREPGSVIQIKLYGLAMERHSDWAGFFVEVPAGEFFMTRSGKPTEPYDLTEVTEDELVTMFEELDSNIEAGNFPAKPSPRVCQRCDVQDWCRYKET